MYEVTMPRLSDSMTEGKIIAWKVSVGQRVHSGDALAEIESDKAAMELECFRDGVVAKILRGDGEVARVGDAIAQINDEAAAASAEPPKPEEEKTSRVTAEKKTAVKTKEAAGKTHGPPPKETPPARPEPAEAPMEKPAATPPEKRARISPYARKLAAERGVDIAQLRGAGAGGRIMAADVERAHPGVAPKTTPEKVDKPDKPEKPAEPLDKREPDDTLPPLEPSSEEAEVVEADFRLQTQARRVTAAKRNIPHFHATVAVETSALWELKEPLKHKLSATITHVIIQACIAALRDMPELNRSYDRGRLILWRRIGLGLAVDTPKGLTVAVLHGADQLLFHELAPRINDLVERARADKLTSAERQRATFTITNLGMYDIEHFAPIINPPSAVTLAVAAAQPAVVVSDGGLRAGRIMRLTAACDHRVVEGVAAAKFLGRLKKSLEIHAN